MPDLFMNAKNPIWKFPSFTHRTFHELLSHVVIFFIVGSSAFSQQLLFFTMMSQYWSENACPSPFSSSNTCSGVGGPSSPHFANASGTDPTKSEHSATAKSETKNCFFPLII